MIQMHVGGQLSKTLNDDKQEHTVASLLLKVEDSQVDVVLITTPRATVGRD
jgi:hypothetical protein